MPTSRPPPHWPQGLEWEARVYSRGHNIGCAHRNAPYLFQGRRGDAADTIQARRRGDARVRRRKPSFIPSHHPGRDVAERFLDVVHRYETCDVLVQILFTREKMAQPSAAARGFTYVAPAGGRRSVLLPPKNVRDSRPWRASRRIRGVPFGTSGCGSRTNVGAAEAARRVAVPSVGRKKRVSKWALLRAATASRRDVVSVRLSAVGAAHARVETETRAKSERMVSVVLRLPSCPDARASSFQLAARPVAVASPVAVIEAARRTAPRAILASEFLHRSGSGRRTGTFLSARQMAQTRARYRAPVLAAINDSLHGFLLL